VLLPQWSHLFQPCFPTVRQSPSLLFDPVTAPFRSSSHPAFFPPHSWSQLCNLFSGIAVISHRSPPTCSSPQTPSLFFEIVSPRPEYDRVTRRNVIPPKICALTCLPLTLLMCPVVKCTPRVQDHLFLQPPSLCRRKNSHRGLAEPDSRRDLLHIAYCPLL